MRGRKLAPRLDLLATIQGHYAGEALLALLRLGVLDALATPRKSRALARLAGVDHALLEPVLEFVRRTTEVVKRDHAGRYRLGQPSLAEIVFQLEKFIGAYGPSLRGLEATLRGARSSGAPDDRALARAFAAVAGIRPLEGEILRGWESAACWISAADPDRFSSILDRTRPSAASASTAATPCAEWRDPASARRDCSRASGSGWVTRRACDARWPGSISAPSTPSMAAAC